MSWFSSLRERNLQPEIMDQPDLDPKEHHRALTALARINAWSQSARLLRKPINHWQHRSKIKEFSLLDVACGAGDTLCRLGKWAQQQGIKIQLTGCDISSVALTHAQARSQNEGLSIEWIEADFLQSENIKSYDIVTCTLFLHHLAKPNASRLLERMRESARHLAIVSDLVRCKQGELLAWMFSRIITRSKVVHIDAVRSVQGAFTTDEALQLAASAGWQGASIQRRWPFRFVLQWQREES